MAGGCIFKQRSSYSSSIFLRLRKTVRRYSKDCASKSLFCLKKSEICILNTVSTQVTLAPSNFVQFITALFNQVGPW